LITGFWFDGLLDGEQVSDAELAELWQEHREELLTEHERQQSERCEAWKGFQWAFEDQGNEPCWGEYVFDLVPQYGARLGVDPDATDFGYNASEQDAEPWRQYFERCGLVR
jgi:hypothetical protein